VVVDSRVSVDRWLAGDGRFDSTHYYYKHQLSHHYCKHQLSHHYCKHQLSHHYCKHQLSHYYYKHQLSHYYCNISLAIMLRTSSYSLLLQTLSYREAPEIPFSAVPSPLPLIALLLPRGIPLSSIFGLLQLFDSKFPHAHPTGMFGVSESLLVNSMTEDCGGEIPNIPPFGNVECGHFVWNSCSRYLAGFLYSLTVSSRGPLRLQTMRKDLPSLLSFLSLSLFVILRGGVMSQKRDEMNKFTFASEDF